MTEHEGSRTGCLKFPVILPRDGKCGHNGRRGSPDRGSVASGSAGHCRTVEAISSGPVGEIMESLNACMASRNNMYVLHTGWKCVNITRRNRNCELDLRIVRSVIRVLSQPCMQFLSCNCYTFPVGMRCSVFTGCVVKADLHLPHPLLPCALAFVSTWSGVEAKAASLGAAAGQLTALTAIKSRPAPLPPPNTRTARTSHVLASGPWPRAGRPRRGREHERLHAFQLI